MVRSAKARASSKTAAPAERPRAQACCAVRALLRKDVFTKADWNATLEEFAQAACVALSATEAMVALYDDSSGAWSACTSDGRLVSDLAIGLYGSRSVLERVRLDGKPMLTTHEAPLILESESITRNEVMSVLAVPLHFWDVTEDASARRIGGCVYAHRDASQPRFTVEHADLMRDLTELAQRTLNLLQHLNEVKSSLAASQEELDQLRRQSLGPVRLGRLETRDPRFARNVLEPLRRVSYAQKVGLLLLGPTGSGKTRLAEAYHHECPRKDRPFVVLDCAQALSAETLGPELFGYARDSGYANAPRGGLRGKAEQADGGTLFIDEIGSLPLTLQHKLLRLIQEGRYSPLGSSEERKVDLQVIAASNVDLEELVALGRFREDLYHRIRELTVRLPSLNERAADIPMLAAEHLAEARVRFGRRDVKAFTRDAVERLLRHDWSRDGNIRGLVHAVSRSVLLAPRGATRLNAEHVQLGERAEPAPGARMSTGSWEKGSGPEPETSSRSSFAGIGAEGQRRLLASKIVEHAGVLSAMAADPEVMRSFKKKGRAMASSTLRERLNRLGLGPRVAEERARRTATTDMERLRDAILSHGTATEAARHLGMSRDALVWQLRKQGVGVRDVLAGGP